MAGSCASVDPSLELDFNPYLFAADFAWVCFGALAFTATGSVFQPNMPSMPRTDNLAFLDDAFAQREAQVWTEILDGIDAVVPAKDRDIQPVGFDGMAETFRRQFR